METQIFAVVSWGCAATAWLAKALNSHPEVFSTHAVNYYWRKYGAADGSDLIDIIDEAAAGVYLAAGDVHGISRERIPEIKVKYADRFRTAVLIREPVARLKSQVALFKRENYAQWGDLKYVDPLIAAAGIDPQSVTTAQRHFFHGANMLNAIIDERAVGPIFRMEDVTRNHESFLDLFRHLTADRVPFSADWGRAAVSAGGINGHRSTQIEFGPFERKIIDSVVKPEAWHLYRELGYPAAEV
jgi:hypothetical protein